MAFFIFDDEYVRRLRERDRETSEHFVRYFQEHFRITLPKHVHLKSSIEDITQDVFLVVLEKLDKGESPGDAHKFGAWVVGIARNKGYESNRKEDRRPEPIDDREFASGAVPADEEVSRKETSARIEQVLSALEPKDARLLRAIHLEDRDPDELCRELRIEAGYLRVLHYRARARFRAEYKRRFPGL